MVRSLRRAFFASGKRLCRLDTLASKRKTETGEESSYTVRLVSECLDEDGWGLAYPFSSIVERPNGLALEEDELLAKGEG